MKTQFIEHTLREMAHNLNRYAAICRYKNSELTDSVYVVNCKDESEALTYALEYFQEKNSGRSEFIKNKLPMKSIEILPRGCGRWTDHKPILIHHYEV